MIVLASVVAIGASMNTWLNRQLLDTDNWVEASDQILLTNRAVRAALSTYLVNELFSTSTCRHSSRTACPTVAGARRARSRPGAPPTRHRRPSTGVLASPQVQEVWRKPTGWRTQTLVRILKDDTREAVSTTDGVVTLNLGTVVTNLGAQLGLPQARARSDPTGRGRDHDRRFASSWPMPRTRCSVVEKLSVVLLLVVIVLYAAAVFIASDRRAAVRNVGHRHRRDRGCAHRSPASSAVDYLAENIKTATDVRSAINAAALIGTNVLNEIAWTLARRPACSCSSTRCSSARREPPRRRGAGCPRSCRTG